ncbi:membrane protein insertase YidC [Candidatus Soleaferrea massiliensis]|uniref:membrane protein insertase YidC n=1 Tax=Candidatus Soleaferrea massiliensis TaxID=1470354 RepID=UPI00058C12AB|nr:membrane protein insertase YidC [Candidatus Soleaferrea massiliensis]
MNQIIAVIGYPLGWVMWLCYQIVNNYGFALILFTILLKLVVFPLSLKQQKSTAKMAIVRPKMAQLQKMYAKNPEKLNEEQMKLYKENGISPFAGCLPTLIQFPILFGLINVIYNPLSHIVRLSSDVIEKAATIAQTVLGDAVKVVMENGSLATDAQINIINAVDKDPSAFGSLGQDIVNRIQHLDLSFFGMNLADKPSFNFNLLIILPILVVVTSLLLSLMTTRMNSALYEGQQGCSMKVMMFVMPLMMAWFTFQVPAGVGVYYVITNLLMMLQTFILNKIHNPALIAEQARLEAEEQAEREKQERIEARKRAQEEQKERAKNGQGKKPVDEKALTQKEINKRKLAEARRRDAERYGEEYIEVTDEDLK